MPSRDTFRLRRQAADDTEATAFEPVGAGFTGGPDEAASGRRRLFLIGLCTVSLVMAFVVAGLAAYGRDAAGAVAGDCLYDAGASVIAPWDEWRLQPCALPAPSGEGRRVVLRVETTADPDECAEELPSWNDERDTAIVVDSGDAAVLLCTTPLG
ncbi:hypothetical protein GCM10027447_31580 [Glycomyces halotolerans]